MEDGGNGGYGPNLTQHLPFFDERQVIATETLFDLLAPRVRSGDIHTIVDLGCGSGEVLIGLAALFGGDRRGGGEAIRLIGIDDDNSSILDAKRRLADAPKLGDGVSCAFRLCDTYDNCLDVFSRVFAECEFSGHRAETLSAKRNWPDAAKETAVFCLGHTIFHLPYLPELLEKMEVNKSQRPRLWVVDVYHSWDSVLKTLSNGVDSVDEPRSYGDGGEVLYSLTTKLIDDGKVERGLISRRLDRPGYPRTTEVSTHQFAWQSAKLIDEFAKAGYFVAHDAPAVSGYGEMTRFVLEPTERTFELPALFLDGKAVPNFPRQQAANDSDTGAAADASVKTAAEASLSAPMPVIAQWIRDSGFIGARAGRGFDFVLVETAPWFFDPAGRAQLRHELLVCAKEGVLKVDQQRAALRAYEAALKRFLDEGESLFFHPDFVGRCAEEHWAPVHFSLVSQSGATRDDPAAECDLVSASLGSDPDEFELDWPGEIDALLLYRSQDDFTGNDPNYHVQRHWPPGADKKQCLWDGLDALHQKLHAEARIAFGEAAAGLKTVLLGIPLRAKLAPAGEHAGIPDWFRGGVWIFAGASGQYEGAEHALLGDLARLTVFLQSSAIEAKAIQALSRYISDPGRRLADYFGAAITAWDRAVTRATDIFKAGELHNPHNWNLHQACTGIAEETQREAIKIARELWASAAGQASLPPETLENGLHNRTVPAVVSLFAAAKYQGVSVRAVDQLLRRLGKEGIDITKTAEIPPNDLRIIMPRKHPDSDARMYPETLLPALAELLISGNHLRNNKIIKALTLVKNGDDPPIWSITITIKYEDDDEGLAVAKALLAKNALEKLPWARATEPGRKGRPGQATMARWALGYLSLDAADELYNPPIQLVNDGNSLEMVFRFEGGELPDGAD